MKRPRSIKNRYPLRVLVVDDEITVANLIRDILLSEGYEVETVHNGEEALSLLQQDSFDLVITDILMPGLDGLELLKRAKSISPGTVFLVITGHGKLDYAIQALREGAAEFILKPFKIADLKSAIKSSLDKKRLEEELSRLQTLASLLEVFKDISSALDLDELLKKVLSTVVREFGFQHIMIHLIDPQTGQLKTFAQHGGSHEVVGQQIEKDRGIIGEVVSTGRPLRLDELRGRETEYMAGIEGVRSLIAVPIKAQERTIGVLSVESHQPGYFSEDDEYILAILANQVGIAIENVRLYQQLSLSKNRLEAVFDAIPDNISLLSPDYTIIMANKPTVTRYNTTFKELLGSKCYVKYRNRNSRCENCPVTKVLETKRPATVDSVVLPINQEIAHIAAYPLLDEKGEIRGIIKYERIITEQKRLEQHLIQSEKLAALGEMAASLGHELNNYLNGIYLHSQRLPSILDNRERALASAKIIEEYVEKMSLLTRAMMDFGRLETQKEICDINSIIKKTMDFLKPQNKFDNIEFILELDHQLPTLMVDPNQIQQVLVNIFNNAAEAMGQGKLMVRTVNEEENIRIIVADEGPGIPAEFLNKVFEPHFTTKEKGYGFGLAICYRIVQKHAGRIEIDSYLGKGTRVNITLPKSTTVTSYQE